MAPNDNDLRSKLRALRKKLVQYLFLLLMSILFGSGLVLVIIAARLYPPEVWRDIGIAMLIAGTVGLGVELFSRREMEKVLGDLIEEKLTQWTGERLALIEAALGNLDQQVRSEAQALQRVQEDVFPRLKEIRDLVRESALQDLGLKRLSLRRENTLLTEFIKKAEPGSTIRILALCLNSLANNFGKDLLKEKMQEGCQIRLLLLDPSVDAVLEERARQENRKSAEDIQEFKERVRAGDAIHERAVLKLNASKEPHGSIEMGYYQSLPSCFLIDIGHVMLVGLYLHGRRGDQCPHLEIENKKNGAYQQFERHFESLWARRVAPIDRRQRIEPVVNERRLRVA
jgi:hypothetical protein